MNKGRYPVNISALNLINICIDKTENQELQGRFYHYYSPEPVRFSSILDLIRQMEHLFDELAFPQSSTIARSFFKQEHEEAAQKPRPEKQIGPEQLVAYEGELGSFITCVKFRQKSTWQGEFYWKEEAVRDSFNTALEFVRKISCAVKREGGK